MSLEFYKNKRVLVTGHTGFKGSWLCQILKNAGADVYGMALEPEEKSLFNIAHIAEGMHSYIGDIRDQSFVNRVISEVNPEIVLHLAAQPIVREGYKSPVYTYETNVMGTVYVLDALRSCSSVQSILNVTTDKVYENNELPDGFCENEPLDGYDPYANSKSCSELVTHCYIRSFFNELKIPVSTARAGNVIGGGDFSKDRIIPDCVRAGEKAETIAVRNPYSVRPYQHVLEPLFAYLMIAEKQAKDPSFAGYYNVGPDECDCVETGALVDYFTKYWADGLSWENKSDGGPHEATFLRLNCNKLKNTFNWKPHWHVEKAVEKTVEWEKVRLAGQDVVSCMNAQIKEFLI